MKNSPAKRTIRIVNALFVMLTATVLISSCDDKEETLSAENTETSNNETILESTSDELDDLATAALNTSEPASGGRVRSTQDNRFDCDGTTVLVSASDDKTSGTATITFGPDGCTDPRGNVRKGTIIVNWTGGRWFQPGSTQTIYLQNYSINGIAIGGTRTRTCTSASGNLTAFSVQWNVSATHTFTFADQSTASRTVNKTVKWDHTAAENTYTITTGPNGAHTATGVNRLDKEYTMDIESPLVIMSSCVQANKVFLPVSGVKILTRVDDQKTLEFDFGDGDCDNTFTVTVDGMTKTITAKNENTGG